MGFMPRGIFGMRLVLVVKVSAESWFRRHSPLNAALCVQEKTMRVIDAEDQQWFLFEHEGKLYLDASCNHSFLDYTYMIELNENEVHRYQSQGREYLNRLSHDIHYSAPIVKGSQSAFKGRDVTKQFSTLASEAIEKWRVLK